jgi:hypothetical protein
MPDDPLLYSEEHILEQIKTAPFTLGFYTLRFYSENGRPVNRVTPTVSEFHLYPSGGTLRDADSNIVFYSSRFDTYRGFVHPHLRKRTPSPPQSP